VPVHERLSTREVERLRREAAEREAARLENELKGATFAPEIPVVSTVLARKKTEEALQQLAAAQELERLEASGAMEALAEEAPASPEVGTSCRGSKGKKPKSPRGAGGSPAPGSPAAHLDLSVVGSAMTITQSPEAAPVASPSEPSQLDSAQ
jgi:hypothetical protein